MSDDTRPLLRAFLWMLGAIVSFTLIVIAGREIQQEMNSFELMFYRSTIGFFIVAVLVTVSRRGYVQIRLSQIKYHVFRNVIHFAAQNLWFITIMILPLGQAVALEFTSPIWVALLAPFFLPETFTKTKVVAAIIGFVGILVVARPGIEPLQWGHLTGISCALGFALVSIFTKRIMTHDTVLCVLFWMTASQAVFGLFSSVPGGIPVPSKEIVPWLALVSTAGLTAHFSLTSALSHAPATFVAPMEFTRLPLIVLVGAMFYDEPMRITLFAGALLIFGGNLLNIKEQTRARSAAG